MRIFFTLKNDNILENSSDFVYPMAQMFMPTVQTSSFVDMLTCSVEVQFMTILIFSEIVIFMINW